MRKTISVLSILVFIQTASVLAEQDATVSEVMKGSRTIGGQSIEYPKTHKAEIASFKIEIQPGRKAVATCIHTRPPSTSLREH